ncbi:hypothetical protein ALC62_11594 [Cyphomyrmex costatus]|uniref:Uncharacterized protein n=1 Tax=Cyphomyrmex costatus TaxID=456900 RepID=A0A151ICB5_9HYME|nr:hypothetical protein ALC62_11594 [Cyphomyrmex costatus]
MRDIDFRPENRFLNKGRIICPQGFTECNEKLIDPVLNRYKGRDFHNKINLTEQLYLVKRECTASDTTLHRDQRIQSYLQFIFNIPKMEQSSNVTVSWVWQKNMMYNKSGLAGDCRNNLQQRKRNYSELLAARSALVT